MSENLIEFWQWAYSDMRSNTVRPLVAEFLVGKSLGCLDTRGRREWAAWDHEYRGAKIEVKSSGRVQSWSPAAKSRTVFGIPQAKNAWCADEEKYLGPGRHADIYIFAVNTQSDPKLAELFDESDWVFYVLPVSEIEARFACQKTVSLSVIERIASPINIAELKNAVDALIG
jgi:hypothetical protein